MRLSTTNAWASKIGFNPRTHKGCDAVSATSTVRIVVSIHAPIKDATNAYKVDFESNGVSIHAPIKDATYLSNDQAYSDLFQSTHP